MEFQKKLRYGFEDLCAIMTLLRAPDGCPWDREQDHHSIRMNFIEETYEAVEAIDTEDTALLLEELGDVLLQVVFHAEMEREAGRFSIDDVCDEICKKLIVRHPHVFADVQAEDTEAVLRNWDAIKRATKGQKTDADAMRSVARSLPALMRAEKVLSRARRAGYQPMSEQEAVEKTMTAAGIPGEEGVGKLLFAAVALAKARGVDPELALTHTVDDYLEHLPEHSGD